MTTYHSAIPGIVADYARRILAVWPGAAAYSLAAPKPDGAAGGTDGEHHDYTPEFATQLAADAARRRAREPAPGQPSAVPQADGLLLQIAATSRSTARRALFPHEPAWPRAVLSPRVLQAVQ